MERSLGLGWCSIDVGETFMAARSASQCREAASKEKSRNRWAMVGNEADTSVLGEELSIPIQRVVLMGDGGEDGGDWNYRRRG